MLNKYIKCNVWRLAVRYDIYIYIYIYVIRRLKVNKRNRRLTFEPIGYSNYRLDNSSAFERRWMHTLGASASLLLLQALTELLTSVFITAPLAMLKAFLVNFSFASFTVSSDWGTYISIHHCSFDWAVMNTRLEWERCADEDSFICNIGSHLI